MQLGDPSTVLETSSGEAVVAVTVKAAHDEGINGGGEIIIGMDTTTTSDEEKAGRGRGHEGDKINSGANRWPRQETLALLKIRSDMDAVFRDSSLKAPLWEEVSRKLAELDYHRSAKKCKEKFENVYKYHKRTKESRSGKPEGKIKTYRFFDQLQALETRFTLSHHPPKPQPLTTMPFQTRPSDSSTISYLTTTTTTLPSPIPPTNASINPRIPSSQGAVPLNMNLFSTTTTITNSSTSSSTASDEDLEERYRKKRKWKDYFRKLTRHVLARQEEMHRRFLEAIDKREHERVAQQEAWRMQEMVRINREHEILVQERSTAAAKDAAVISFLQKLSSNNNNFLQQPPPPPPPPPQPVSQVQQPQPQQQQTQELTVHPTLNKNNGNNHNNNNNVSGSSSSRWPQAEVHALIRLRTSLEAKYQDNGAKAPMWEEISGGMKRLGYERSAKRCKEKWENINKYFKKMKESNKQRREDSKTCPYFDELEALYKEKSKIQNPFGSMFHNMKANEMMEPLMVQPEQQWRPPPQQMEEGMEDEEDGDVEEEEEGGYEIGTNKLPSVDTVE